MDYTKPLSYITFCNNGTFVKHRHPIAGNGLNIAVIHKPVSAGFRKTLL